MSDFGVHLYNSAGRVLCNGVNPTLGFEAEIPVVVMPGTDGTPVLGTYYGMWANDARVNPGDFSLGLLPLTQGFTAPAATTTGYIGYNITGAASSPVKLCKPMSRMSSRTGEYGMSVFNADGELVFDTLHQQVIVRDVVTLTAAEAWGIMANNQSPTKLHASANNPLYVIDGLQCVGSQYGPFSCGYYGFSYWYVAKVSVKAVGGNQIQFYRNGVGYMTYDGANACVATNNGAAFRSTWGTPTTEYNTGQELLSMWCQPTLSVLVCELLDPP